MEDGTLPPFDVDKQSAYLRRLLRKGGTLLFARTSCLCTHSCEKCNEITPTDSLRLGRGETRGRERAPSSKQTNSLQARVGEAVDRAHQVVAIGSAAK